MPGEEFLIDNNLFDTGKCIWAHSDYYTLQYQVFFFFPLHVYGIFTKFWWAQ